jgi:hypothetical protein
MLPVWGPNCLQPATETDEEHAVAAGLFAGEQQLQTI